MTRSRRSRSSRVLLTAATALVGVAFASPVARAEAGSDVAASPEAVVAAALGSAAVAVPDASVAAEAVEGVVDTTVNVPADPVTAEPTAAEEDIGSAAVPESSPPAAEAPVSGSDPAPTAAEPVPSPSSGAAAPPLGGDAADDAGAAGDTTAPSPVSPPAPAPDPVQAAQVGAVNVNVSIRVESPGDAGSVTQVNAVDAASTVAVPDAPRAADDIARDTDDAPDNAAADPVDDDPCDASRGCCTIVTLVLACLDVDQMAFSFEDIGDLLNTLFGNTGAKSTTNARPPVTAIQYRPVNVNISIRIKSPGNDGPVAQANLVQIRAAVSVAIPVIVPPAVPPADPSAEPAAPAVDVAVVTAAAPVDPEVAAVPEIAAADDVLAALIALAPAAPPVASAFLILPAMRISVLQPPISVAGVVISPSLRLGGRPGALWTGPAAAPRATPPTDDEQATREAGTRRAPHRAPAHRAPAPVPTPILPPLAASLAPSSPAGSGGGGGLPLALVLPFAIGLLDLGLRRVRASRLTPSDHPGRRPERPG